MPHIFCFVFFHFIAFLSSFLCLFSIGFDLLGSGGFFRVGNASFDDVGVGLGDHLDAVDDGTDGDAKRASRAILRHACQVRLCVEFDGLIPGIVTRHVAFALGPMTRQMVIFFHRKITETSKKKRIEQQQQQQQQES